MRTNAVIRLILPLALLLTTACPAEPTPGNPVGDPAGGAGGEGGGGDAGRAGGGVAGSKATLGSFKGDSDIIGTWDVTLKDDDDDELSCTAEISTGLKFVITCASDDDNYDEGCDIVSEKLRVTGSIAAAGEGIKIDEISRYSGPKCASYGFESDKEYTDHELEIEIAHKQTGVGSLGGKWTANIFEFSTDCANEAGTEDGGCKNEVSTRDLENACDFNLEANGAITVNCLEPADESEDDCSDAVSASGSIGGGKIDVSLKMFNKGSACTAEDGDEDLLTVHAVRR